MANTRMGGGGGGGGRWVTLPWGKIPGFPHLYSSLRVHGYLMVTSRTAPIEGKFACSARELEEYEDVRGGTKLEDCGSVGGGYKE